MNSKWLVLFGLALASFAVVVALGNSNGAVSPFPVDFSVNGTPVAQRSSVNIIEGTSVTVTGVDSGLLTGVEYTVNSSAAGGVHPVAFGDIAAGAVDSAAILDDSVASVDILLDTIVAVDIATGGVGTLEILDGSILAVDLNQDDTPVDGDILAFDSTGANFVWEVPAVNTDMYSFAVSSPTGLRMANCIVDCTSGGTSSDIFLTADEIWATPLYIGIDDFYDTMVIYVTTAGAAGEDARVGIYDNAALGWSTYHYPNNLVVDCGTIAIDSTSVKEITCASTELLAGNLYWLAIVSESATVEILVFDNPASGGLASTLIGVLRSSQNRAMWGFSDSHTCGAGCVNSLPNPFPQTSPSIKNSVTNGQPMWIGISPS